MLQLVHTTDALPLSVVAPLLPEDFQDVPYSSCFLLPASFPDVIVNDPLYVEWCETGFALYFDDPYNGTSSLSALKVFILQEMFPGSSDDAPFVQHIGFLHGWLSALAFIHRALALQGLDILAYLTDHLVFLSFGS
jgi:hypothetical protein